MTQFYLKLRKDTLAQKVAPKLPQGFFTPKKRKNKKINKKI